MKILFINSVYGEKSTGNLVKYLRTYANDKGEDTLVVYGRGSRKNDAYKVQNRFSFFLNVFLSRIFGKTWNCFCISETKKIIRAIEDFKPDIINIHQSYGYYVNPSQLFYYISSNHIKTVVTLHDFTHLSGKCGYPLDCNKFIEGCSKCPRKHEYPKYYFFDNTKNEYKEKMKLFNSATDTISFVAVSKWLEKMARLSSITRKSNIYQIDNGINTSYFKYIKSKKDSNKIVLVVSSNFKDKIKGGDLLIKTIQRVFELDQNINFVLIGKNSNYIKKFFSNNNVVSLGRCSHEVVRDWYQKSTCSFMPSQSETFSLPTVESLCCGLPVFGPKGCGAPEFLIDHPLCNFSTERNPVKLAQVIKHYCDSPAKEEELLSLSLEVKKQFDEKLMGERYLNLFRRIHNNEK